MEYGSSLPLTGAGIMVGGVLFDQTALLSIAIGAIVLGAVFVRYSFRRNRTATEV